MLLLLASFLGAFGVMPSGPTTDDCPEDCTLTAQPTTATISVDGFLDEAVWGSASVATDFLQYEPEEGSPATQRTEVKVLYGSSALYIGVMLHDEEPDKIRTLLGRRDQFNQADWFIASIDSYFDRKTAYNFAVSASGVQADGIYTGRFFGGGGGGGFDFDESWDAVWHSEVRITPDGWVVEMRIPYSMLRFSNSSTQRWGINFRRVVPRLSEITEWVLVPRTERSSGTVAHYGTLEGIVDIKSRRNIQVTPYSVGTARMEEGDVPGTSARSATGDTGTDLKVSLSPNITLDATINPDFGQVEADPAELNLSAFETFFPEQRPFFTEGVQIFTFSLDRGGSLLYTRRIGSRAPIILASKISGRTNKGLNFGYFGATTGDKFSPSNYYGVGRVQQQIGELSNLGGMVTYYNGHRSYQSLTGGADWDMRFKDNRYRLDGQFSMTHRFGNTDNTGFALTTGLDRLRSLWNFSSGLTIISDDYNPNDLGRLRRNDYINMYGGFSHQINGGEAFGPFQRATVRLYAGSGFSYTDLISNGTGFFFRSDWTTRGFQEIEFGMEGDYLFGGYDFTETRGQGPRARPAEFVVFTEYETDSRRTWSISPGVGVATYGGDGGFAMEYGVGGRWVASPRLSLSLGIKLGREFGTTEWAANESFFRGINGEWNIGGSSGRVPENIEDWYPLSNSNSFNTALSGRRPYDSQGRHFVPVFGERDTQLADVTLRANVTLTPRLAIQLYGQLFAARGRYTSFLLLQNRDTLVPVEDYPKRYDFGFNNFQTNTVLRWEYRPGSVIYLVWTQSRSGSSDLSPLDFQSISPYDQTTTNHMFETFDIYPTNVISVKVSYKFLR